jgi:hypothetical protein
VTVQHSRHVTTLIIETTLTSSLELPQCPRNRVVKIWQNIQESRGNAVHWAQAE